MLRSLIFLGSSLLLLSNCTRQKSDIRVVCEAAPQGGYVIKWETFPPMNGIVKIYESSSPDSFNLSSPIAEAEISKGFKEIFLVQTTKRSYFNLVFDKKYSVKTAERAIPMVDLFNFRDLGGYFNTDGKQIRWGKLYRSSSLARAKTQEDIRVLKNIGIQTVIDFRTERERYDAPSKYLAPNIINLPLRGNPYNTFFDRILSNEMKVGDVRVYAQGMFAFLLENNSEYFNKMFDVLLEEDNYPVLIECSLGSERSAVASALILAALNIDMDQIISDYMLSNELLDFDSLINSSDIFSKEEGIQETLTALIRVHKGTITYSFDKILKDYGTLDNFFNTSIRLSAENRERLKEMMLY